MHFKVIYNTLAQVINRLALSGSAFLVSLLLARFFGASGFGEYSKATTYISIFYLLTDFGLNAVILRKISQQPENEQKIISGLFGLRSILALFLTVIAILIIPILPYNQLTNEGFTPVTKLAIAALSILIVYQAFVNSANLIFQKHLKYDFSTIASIGGSLVTVGATMIFLFVLKASLPLTLLSYSLGGIITGILMIYFIRKLKVRIMPWFSYTTAVSYLKSALPLGLTLVFNLVYFRADVFILTLTRTTVEVGNYGLAYKFFEFALTIPTFFANSLYPLLLIRSKDKEKFRGTVFKAGLFLLTASFIVMLIFYFASPLLRFIRADFTPAVSILKLLSLSMPFFFISSLFMWILITYGKNWQLLRIYLAGMILNIILNLIFIPTYGTPAAAIITLISELFIVIVNGWMAVKILW